MLAHQTRQPLRGAASRNDSEVDLRLAEAGIFSRDYDVATHSELATATESESAYRGDHGFGNFVDAVAVGQSLLKPLIEWPAIRHFLNVCSRGENLLATCDDDHAYLIITVELLH